MALSLAAIRAALDADAIQIVVNGTSYQGWQQIDMDSDILNPADAFEVVGNIPKVQPAPSEVRAGAPSKAFDDFREGNSCDLFVGLDRQMAGAMDEVTFSGNRHGSSLKISGRDKGAFLIDNEAKHIKASQYTVKTLIEALLDKTWDIRNVLLSNEDNRKLVLGKRDKKPPKAIVPRFLQLLPRNRTKIDPGTRVATVIDTHCRRIGMTWWLTAQGDLFIGKPNYNQEPAYNFSAGAFGTGTPTNVESWDVTYSVVDRFSEIRVVGQGFATPARLWSTSAPSPKVSGVARDPDLVERGIVRKVILVDCDVLSKSEAQARADFEMGKRRMHGLTIKVTVPGFRQNDRLFAVDTMATVKLEEIGINGSFYVTQRRFTERRQQRRTQLTLVQPKLWLA
jgi:prophage tail gpP-like protein